MSQSSPGFINKKNIIKNLIFVLALGLGINIIFSFYTDFGKMGEALKTIKLGYFLIPFFVYIVVYLIESLRLTIVLRLFKYKISFKDSFFNSAMGYLFSYLTPLASGGQPFQIYHLKTLNVKARESSSIIISRFVENTISIIIIILIFIRRVLDIVYTTNLNRKILFLGLVTSLFFAIFFLFFLIRPDYIGKFAKKIETTKFIILLEKKFNKQKLSEKINKWTIELKNSVTILWRENLYIMILDIFLGLIVLLLQAYSMYYLFFKIIKIDMNFFEFSLIYFLIMLVSFYVPTPGASGGIESAYILVFLDFFKNKSLIVLSIFLWRISTYYLQIFFLFILMGIYFRKTKGDLHIGT
ncbi:lysylphosphatidylglycerol synthase transmembrane domain-containing protein [Marinitoga aeolica]|uniref:Flippase-like domain-containing protein n=1 Tax=Marinitoga aeolica TaxID=2809031 RepID=A0ABY8PQX6_9BACT|nr:lysylphosphatidylglycerol synthase transmembrane domain-containing protein [Marinitoga aeolica]WGS65028.1 flippase-like domain-containing protein [Marinitoga aeolica]